MEINKKLFCNVLSQIKAYKDVIVLRDSSVEGCLDILYSPKSSSRLIMSKCVNKMTIRLDGSVMDLFDSPPVEKLGEPILVFLNRVKEVLRNAQTCVLEDGCINGIRVTVEASDLSDYPLLNLINEVHKQYSDKISRVKDFELVSLKRVDYVYMVSECSKFISKDETRLFMNGVCFDFVAGGKDFIHMAATDGRKMCVLKQAASHSEYPAGSEDGRFIVPLDYLCIPDTDYTLAKIKLSKSSELGQISISTEDYYFEGVFERIEGYFPNYIKVVPEVTEKTQWFTLCPASLRMTIDSVKSLMGKPAKLYLHAENPENMNIVVGDSSPEIEIEGTASRPMKVSFLWEHLSSCLFDGLALTKFWLNGSGAPIVCHEARAIKGLSLDVTKVLAPTVDECKNCDNFRMPKANDEPENKSSEPTLPSYIDEPEGDSEAAGL